MHPPMHPKLTGPILDGMSAVSQGSELFYKINSIREYVYYLKK